MQTQQRFKTERHNVFTKEINKIALSSNDDKRMQSVDSIETYAYGTSKYLVSEKEEIKCSNIIARHKRVTKEGIKEHNPNWPQIADHPYILYVKDPYEAKYQLVINKRESTGLKHFNDSKAFIE